MSRIVSALCLLPCLVLGSTPLTSRTAEPQLVTEVAGPGQTLADFLPGFTYTKTDIDPGVPPEGDLMGWAAFTRDGSRVILTNRATGNITVFNWATMQVERNVDVGSFPSAIAVTDSFAVITRAFADSVVIVRLSDWTIAARLQSGVQPWTVHVSPDQSRAYVACDISNTCEVYDLATLTRVATIANFRYFLSTYTFNSENGRWSATFSDFALTPDGSHIIVPDGIDTIFWINTATGEFADTLSGIGGCRFVSLSGDGRKAVIANSANPCVVRRIDLATREVDAGVTITGHSLMTYETAVDSAGAKAFLGISDNKSCLVRFATSDFKVFSNTYTAFWVGVSPDHRRAISGQYNFSIVDFALDSVLGQHSGNSQSVGAVSPAGTRAVGFDPHRHEGLYFYDYSSPGPGMFRGTTNAGADPEGDCPFGIALAPDGSRVISSGVLSDNAAIINVGTGTLDTVLPIADRPRNCAVTSDSRWALAASIATTTLRVIDLATGSIAATIAAGSGPTDIAIAPGDSLAYISNIVGNSITVVRLAGAASYKVADIPVGELGLVWAAYGICSGLAVSPTGEYVLSAVSFDDNVKVISATTNTVVATLAVGDFPLGVEFDSTGEYAIVTNYFGNSYTVMRIDGANSSVIGTFPTGQYPARLRRNPLRNEISLCTYSGKTLVTVNPQTGGVIRTESYSAYGPVYQVEFDESGNPIVLTGPTGSIPGHLHKGTDHIELPAVPSVFSCAPAAKMAAVAMPGPDWVSLVDWTPTGAFGGIRTLPDPGLHLPAVARGRVELTVNLPSQARVRLEVWNRAGRKTATILDATCPAGLTRLQWNPAGLGAGTYFVRLVAGNAACTRPLVLIR
ncbi:MAG: YncE family protein [candidate division WOR-3 bacterium]